MVSQYPDTLIITWEPTPVQDGNGEWEPSGGENGRFEGVCRIEPNGKGQKIAGVDGALIDFAFNVFMPKTSYVIPVEANVFITTRNGQSINSTVKRNYNGQLNSRLWL